MLTAERQIRLDEIKQLFLNESAQKLNLSFKIYIVFIKELEEDCNVDRIEGIVEVIL